jgi:hypothetical protein
VRYLIFSGQTRSLPAHVIAESCDEAWTRDQAILFPGGFVLSEEEAELDPDLEIGLADWRNRTDKIQAEFERLLDVAMDEGQTALVETVISDPVAVAQADAHRMVAETLAEGFASLDREHGHQAAVSFLRSEARQILRWLDDEGVRPLL